MSTHRVRSISRVRTTLAVAGLCLLMPFAAVADERAENCSAPEHRQFDFWLGEWEVFTEDGEVAGRNHIEGILDGCVIQESWQGAKGSRGTSFNIWAARRGVWHQTWVDDRGMLLLDGGLEGDAMVLRGTAPGKDGTTTAQHEISWQPSDDGSVRQQWRVSSDGGATWKDVFVGIYRQR